MEFLNSDKNLAILALAVIAVVAMFTMPGTAKDVVIPIITGIAGFVMGDARKNP